MADMCGDNRFEIIAKAKEHLLDATNIDTSEDEMKVLDSFLFRCWQMGWLDRYDRKTEPNNSEKPNNCDTCRNKGFEGCEQPCLGCGCCGLYAPKDEPTISKMEQVDKDINVRSKDCETCKHYKLACELFSEICKYEPTTQTETQNSNLTFEKDECAKEYEELGLKELKELIKADRKAEQTKREGE